jgi:hypothetical protein
MNACSIVEPVEMIFSNHTIAHTLTIPAADATSMTTMTYMLTLGGSGAGHTHTFTMMPADFATLRAGGTVDMFSSNDAGHMHRVTVHC